MTHLICTAIWHEGRLRRIRLIGAENRGSRNRYVCRKYIEIGAESERGRASQIAEMEAQLVS